MLGAIYIGLSGMDAYGKGLQTISNNVANLNTLGFKATTVNFSDLFTATGGGLTFDANTPEGGGGAGVTLGQSSTNFTEGDLRQTGNDLDLALQGSGFLVLTDGTRTVYTRTGQFAVDNDGYVTLQGTKYHLMTLNAAGQPQALKVDTKHTSPPVATTKITFADNVSSTGTEATVSGISVYDSAGTLHTWQVDLKPAGSASPGSWTVTVTDGTGATVGTGTLSFIGGQVNPSTAKITINSTPTGADPLSVVLDFSSGVTNFSSGTTSTLRAASVDGSAVGTLTTVSVDSNGAIQLAYTNNKTDTLGSVAIADFRDPQLLKRDSAGFYENTAGGQMRYLASAQNGVGTLVSKQVEASNVDLSQEFGDLILIQRGYQASSQVVSVANDMIQDLFGIRGRG